MDIETRNHSVQRIITEYLQKKYPTLDVYYGNVIPNRFILHVHPEETVDWDSILEELEGLEFADLHGGSSSISCSYINSQSKILLICSFN